MKLVRSGLSLMAVLLLTRPLAAQEPAAAATFAIPAPPSPARTSLGVDLGFTRFDGGLDPWTLGAVSLSRRTSAGSVIARVNLAERFGTTGAQYELDAYPRLGGSSYAYLNAGYSAASIFPEWRFGGEAFTSLPHAYEASLGFRQLRFGGDPVTLYTGSVGKYAGNYWLSLRPYVRQKNEGLSASAGLTVRRYYENADQYIGARVSFGSTPSDRVTITEIERSSSFSAGFHGSHELARKLFGTWSIGYEREELGLGRIRNRTELNAGARVDF